jgi:DNA-binding YbaB/EbfC family protein
MNIQQIMKQAQNMQKKMQEEENKLAQQDFEGSAGGDSIKITMTGKRVTKSVSIDPSLIVPEDKDVLEDLLMVALNDVNTKIDKASEASVSSATGGFKLPF